MSASALLLSGPSHTCFRPRTTGRVAGCPPRQQRAVCQSFNRRGGFYGPSGFGMAGPWAPFMNALGDKTIAQLLQDLEREMARVNSEAARQAGRSPYSNGNSSQQTPPSSSSSSSTDLPLAMDCIETDDAVTFWADVPGLNKADLKIRVNQQDRVLTVSGERAKPEAASSPSSDEGKARWERRFGTFKREVTLPDTADLQAISAKVDKGVLRVRVLKEIKDVKPKEQEIIID